jgi:hypothetical protein
MLLISLEVQIKELFTECTFCKEFVIGKGDGGIVLS